MTPQNVIILISIIIVLHQPILLHYVLAFSPPFSSQEIRDPPYDEHTNKPVIPFAYRTNYSDIVTVDYLSDGRFLNATFWLNSPATNVSTNNSTLIYGISIDVDSNKATGYHGVDYIALFVPIKDKWSVRIIQTSTIGTTGFVAPVGAYTYTDHNITANPVKLSLDLAKLHFPTKYRAMFLTEEISAIKGNITIKDDLSNWVDIPPPRYMMRTSPSPVEIRPGDTSFIGADLVSDTGDAPNVSNFVVQKYAIQVILEKMDPSPSFIITVPSDTRPGIYSIPMLANITPEPVIAPGSVTQFLSSPSFEVKGNSIPVSVNLSVKVLNPLTLGEQFRNFWETFGGFISFIGGGLAAGLGAMIVGTLRKGKEKGQKRLSNDYE